MQKANITLDIYSFPRSQDVADYCWQIGHVFNPLEMAIIINRSEKTPMEKMFAWQILIDHYPDMSLHISVPFKIKDRLHEYLRALIVFYRNHIKRFYKKESDAKYSLITPSVNDLLGIENPDVLEQVRTDPKAFFSGKEKTAPSSPAGRRFKNLMRYQNAVYAIQEYTAVREECVAEKNELIDYWKNLTE